MKRFRRGDCGWHPSHGLGTGRGNPPSERRRVLEARHRVAWGWKYRKSECACSYAHHPQPGKHASWREVAGRPGLTGRAGQTGRWEWHRDGVGADGVRGENPECVEVAASRSSQGLEIQSWGAVVDRGVAPAASASGGGGVPWGQLGSSAAQKADVEKVALVEKSWKIPVEARTWNM